MEKVIENIKELIKDTQNESLIMISEGEHRQEKIEEIFQQNWYKYITSGKIDLKAKKH